MWSFWFTGQVLVVLWHCVSCECITLTFHSFIHSFNRITGWFYVRQRYIHIAPYAAARADSLINAYHLLPDDAQRDHTIIAKINIRGLQRWQYCTPMADPVKVQPISVYIWCRHASQQTLTRTATDPSQPRAGCRLQRTIQAAIRFLAGCRKGVYGHLGDKSTGRQRWKSASRCM